MAPTLQRYSQPLAQQYPLQPFSSQHSLLYPSKFSPYNIIKIINIFRNSDSNQNFNNEITSFEKKILSKIPQNQGENGKKYILAVGDTNNSFNKYWKLELGIYNAKHSPSSGTLKRPKNHKKKNQSF